MTEEKFSELINRLGDGDMQALKEIYEQYSKMIYSTALDICRDAHLAEDVTSEFFIRLKKAAAVYRQGLGHKKWLIASARNLAIDFIRKQSREVPASAGTDEDESSIINDIADKTDTEEQISSQADMQKLLMRLSDKEREVVNMKIYCQLTFAETAQILRIPIGTVTWRYRSAMKKLKKYYEEVQ